MPLVQIKGGILKWPPLIVFAKIIKGDTLKWSPLIVLMFTALISTVATIVTGRMNRGGGIKF